MKKGNLFRRAVITGVAVVIASGILTGCMKGGKATSFNMDIPDDYSAPLPDDLAEAYDSFAGRVTIKEGIGDFDLKPMKLPSGSGDFALVVRNDNSFPAAAYVLCTYKSPEGELIYATYSETDIMTGGSECVLTFSAGKMDIPDSANVELVAYAKEKHIRAVRMRDNYPADSVKETGRSIAKGGSYDGWLQIDFEHSAQDFSGGSITLLTYDADDRLTGISFVKADDKTFNIRTKDICDHYEVISDRLLEDVPGLPESILDEYRKAGYVITGTEDKIYTSPDGRVNYDFITALDGKILMHVVNTSRDNLEWHIDDRIVLSGSIFDTSDGFSLGDTIGVTTETMFLHPGEDILWDLDIEPGTEFWILPPVAFLAEKEKYPKPKVSIKESEGKKLLEVDAKKALKALDDMTTLDMAATVVYRKGSDIVSAEHIYFYDINDYRSWFDERVLSCPDDYDDCDLYVQYHANDYMVRGY